MIRFISEGFSMARSQKRWKNRLHLMY